MVGTFLSLLFIYNFDKNSQWPLEPAEGGSPRNRTSQKTLLLAGFFAKAVDRI
jgi:hypothetical protein